VPLPWFVAERDTELEQGDLLFSVPILTPTAQQYRDGTSGSSTDWLIRTEPVIVVSHSCDLALNGGRRGATTVVVCRAFLESQQPEAEYFRKDRWNSAIAGRYPTLHPLEGFTLGDVTCERIMVDLLDVRVVPLEFVLDEVQSLGERLRLRHPYRQALSQAFARCYMRVEYPEDIRRL
jgi:hypothetical protein